MSRILVTGASGFIGRAVIAALAKDGHALRAAGRRPPQLPFPPGVEAVQQPDFAHPFDWRPLLDGIDQVIHLAGIAHAGRDITRELYDRVNRRATTHIATAAAQCGVQRFVFLSSIGAQSGPTADHALTERDPPRPTTAYGRSKLAAEEAVRTSGVAYTILRPVLIYGPGVKGNFGLMFRAAASRLPLPVKHFSNRRSLLGIDNFISALRFVLASPATVNETYVVSDPGVALRLSDVIAVLRQARGRRSLVLPMPTGYFEIPLRLLRRTDLWDRVGGNLRVDAGKLAAAGWRPIHDTRAGLVAMVQAATPRKSGTASRSTR